MKFILHRSPRWADKDEPEVVASWFWDVEVKGEVVATSPTGVLYDTEAEARSSIAKARKAFAGYRFAKVETR